MVECSFANETNDGTLCLYKNRLCYRKSGWDCGLMAVVVREFRDLLFNAKEENWSEEFMKVTIRKYGGKISNA